MVKVNPPILDIEGTKSDGERLVFKRFAETAGGQNWFALHSLDIFPRSGKNQAEADFVILAPGLGILVVEVKAHREVKLENGIWYMSSKAAKRSPIKQASNAVFLLLEYLRERNVDVRNIPVSFVVWFTHIQKLHIPPSIEVNPAGYLGSEALTKDIVEVLTAVMQANAIALNKKSSMENIPVASIEKVLKTLRPNFDARMAPKDREAEVQGWLDSAIKQQVEMFTLMQGMSSILVQGIAGTGKTHIALQEARWADLRGESTLLVCYNRLLAKYLKEQLLDYPLVKVIHIHKLFREIAQVDAKPEGKDWWRDDLPALAYSAMENSSFFGAFDTLIVDEAQDIALPQYLKVLDMVLLDGLANSKTRFFGDFENQGIYIDGAESLENLMSALPDIYRAKLDINCRNSEDLGTEIMIFLDDESAYSDYRRKDKSLGMRPVMPKAGTDLAPLVKIELNWHLKTYEPEQIVLLSSSREGIEELVKNITIPTAPLSSPKPGAISYGTVQEFKGLESLAVVLVEFENTITPSWQNFYIGATRSTSTFSFVLPLNVLPMVTESR